MKIDHACCPMIAKLTLSGNAYPQKFSHTVLSSGLTDCTWHSLGVRWGNFLYPYPHQISFFSCSNSLHTITSAWLAHSSVCDGCHFPGHWWCGWHFRHHFYYYLSQKWVGSVILDTVRPPIFRLFELHLIPGSIVVYMYWCIMYWINTSCGLQYTDYR